VDADDWGNKVRNFAFHELKKVAGEESTSKKKRNTKFDATMLVNDVR
jgi:hypothetical protein